MQFKGQEGRPVEALVFQQLCEKGWTESRPDFLPAPPPLLSLTSSWEGWELKQGVLVTL